MILCTHQVKRNVHIEPLLLLHYRRMGDIPQDDACATGRWTAMSNTGQGASWRIFQAVLPGVSRTRPVPVVPCVLMTITSTCAVLANSAMLSAGVPSCTIVSTG